MSIIKKASNLRLRKQQRKYDIIYILYCLLQINLNLNMCVASDMSRSSRGSRECSWVGGWIALRHHPTPPTCSWLTTCVSATSSTSYEKSIGKINLLNSLKHKSTDDHYLILSSLSFYLTSLTNYFKDNYDLVPYFLSSFLLSFLPSFLFSVSHSLILPPFPFSFPLISGQIRKIATV